MESNWSDIALPFAEIAKFIDELEEKRLPTDELGAERVLTEACIVYHDAQEALALAAQKYRAAQRNWAVIRLKRLKEAEAKAASEISGSTGSNSVSKDE